MAARPRYLPLLLLALLFGSLAGRAAPSSERQGGTTEGELEKYLRLYAEVLTLVRRAHVEESDVATLLLSSLDGVVDALDPLSVYVPAAEVETFRRARTATGDRGGLLIFKERAVAYVAAVEEGSPAAAAGLHLGEIVEEIGGQQTRDLPLWRIQQLLASAGEGPLTLEVRDVHGEQRSVRFALTDFERAAVRTRKVGGASILRIPRFDAGTPREVEDLLPTGDEGRLVVDLRGVAGGQPEAAYAVGERFADGDLGALIGRQGPIEHFRGEVPPAWSGRLAVLVDRGTQGAAEVLAAILRQGAGARLVGERTFGHAGRIAAIELPSGALLELTDAFYAGPDLEPLSASLEPDVEVRPEPTAGATDEGDPTPPDAVLERALGLLAEEAGSGQGVSNQGARREEAAKARTRGRALAEVPLRG